ncbi:MULTISPECIES: fluoride efflux transporter CrcB [Ensifer]|jgi:fluoride exporter|uniref:Fluoride-specific ion channel FluC n=1 Tax=Ensifer canadensis TaxID=555315 RepID=A0AAW4FBF9_9HYPH|nr:MULTISPECIES: fluoride efflux transporter CrcB [Ensifer]KQU77143.1 camphor resistance protein CrcB [Ensifer sp. Root31]KQW52705.1 camphor resistance protein CrcB [Ensifer sp. Root1252]KQW63790.1 camphor resistance protein CrcB [Ensifer sp. Root127]KQY65108.1 camphor resistance protein CrcB [Ensifer sp. Root142]KRC63276.1 camphor resistance protein CrcB [Ensifer sp. Root231]
MSQLLLVGAGGAIGSMARYLVGLWTVQRWGPALPWGTLMVNVTGSFLIGLLAELIMRKFGASPEMRLFLITGVLGGYTTFSAFSLDAIMLLERGDAALALGYIAASIVLSILAVFAGLALMRAMV